MLKGGETSVCSPDPQFTLRACTPIPAIRAHSATAEVADLAEVVEVAESHILSVFTCHSGVSLAYLGGMNTDMETMNTDSAHIRSIFLV